jgi:branched-chain amino acid transport system ATP-binding protein
VIRNILETRNLSQAFRDVTAVDNVSLAGASWPHPCTDRSQRRGQDNLLQALTKFLVPTAGQNLFNNRDITQARPAQIARQGIIRSFQISAVFPHLSVLQNVRIGLQRTLGTSFHFWKSEARLDSLNERALEIATTDPGFFVTGTGRADGKTGITGDAVFRSERVQCLH